MDIFNEEDNNSENEPPGGGLILANELLPEQILLLPQEKRPVFPGQMIPMIIGEGWGDTLDAVDASEHKILGVILAKTDSAEDPLRQEDLYSMGTACRIHRAQKMDGAFQILLEGLQRFRISAWLSKNTPYRAQVKYFPETTHEGVPEIKAYAVAIINMIKELVPLNPLYGEELKVFLQHFHPSEPSQLADFAAALTSSSKEELQEVLETTRILPRLEKALTLINKELEIAKSQMEIRKHVEQEMDSRQREVFLREQLKAIQKELGISKDDRTAELDRFRERLDKLVVPEDAKKRLDEEMTKLGLLETGSPEYAVTRNYLDWLTSLPWSKFSKDSLDLQRARKSLDKGHEGIEDVKQRIVEFIGVGIMKGEVAGSILLFVGPPGVGKTSLGRSIADALKRKFFRFSLGGMRDEAEIKGHRRTYIGAMPGKFIQAIKETGTSNPVIMVDEIDKIGASYQGDPASALLEVLDPEQNAQFLDHYIDVRYDLSKVLFICTANQLDTIAGPLLDRMEIIRLGGYLTAEKLAIARKHLLPRLVKNAGLKPGQLRVEKSAINKIIEGYAREAGVRKLEKRLATLVRKTVLEILEGAEPPIHIKSSDVEDYLGKPFFRKDKRLSGVGIVTGLAWTPFGGATLSIEASRVHQQSRGMKLTGQLGDVMKESGEIAYSFVTANSRQFKIKDGYFEKAFIHLHVPAGATPKDGPSAGITMASALISLGRGEKISRPLAMTGELTLTGQVLAVGGIREKVVAAKRLGLKELILPEANRGDFEELPERVQENISANFVSHYKDVLPLLFG